MRVGILALVTLGGCLQADVTVCETTGVVCPGGTVCAPDGDCITPDRNCDGADGSACAYTGVPVGACKGGVCVPAGCGNDVREPDEACDDGNTNPFDACSGDCMSTNACGNGVIDSFLGEQCDEGDFLDHDGCSSTCRDETPRWRDVTPRGWVERAAPATAYDAARGRVVMFGGGTNLGPIGDTWEWDGLGWSAHNVAPRPPPRLASALAYDARHRVSVLFGGTPSFDDTWTWNGASWTHQDPETRPPARAYHALAYDAGRGEVIVYGGMDPTGLDLDDTWGWDGTTWTNRATTGPGARFNAAMAYDPRRDRVVLFGGTVSAGALLADTWEWDGAQWNPAAPSASPPPIANAAMAYDASRETVVLFGGTFGSSPSDQLWEYDGAAWTRIDFVSGPARREGPGLAYDLARAELVAFGGVDSTGFIAARFNDTWRFDGVWEEQAPFVRPTAAPGGASLAYDPMHAQTLLVAKPDVWLWSGAAWTQAASPGLDGKVAYDAARGTVALYDGFTATREWNGTSWSTSAGVPPAPSRTGYTFGCDGAAEMLVFGGHDQGANVALDDTWRWDGAWTDATSHPAPTPRSDAGLACDPVRGRAVLFGGLDELAGRATHDTWEWDGDGWTDVSSTSSPPDSAGQVLAYDPDQHVTLLFGGAGEDVWAWDGTSWEFVATPVSPASRRDAGLAYDAAHGQLVMFGGNDDSGAVDDTWLFEWTAGGPAEACRYGVDTDGDGKVGCLDPDCWPYCTPLCRTGDPCPVDAPSCGDGTCDPLEDCRLCPDDCGACAPVCGDFLCDPGETDTSCPGDC